MQNPAIPTLEAPKTMSIKHMHFVEDVVIGDIKPDLSKKLVVVSFHFKEQDPIEDIQFLVIPVKEWEAQCRVERKNYWDDHTDRTVFYFLMAAEAIVFDPEYISQ